MVFNGKKKLTITVYYSTGTIHVQGHVCPEWVEDEFGKLKCTVAHLVNMNVSTEDAPGVANVATTNSLLDVQLPAISAVSEEDISASSALIRVPCTQEDVTVTLHSTPDISSHASEDMPFSPSSDPSPPSSAGILPPLSSDPSPQPPLD